jgi:hypothetical protein
LGISFWGALEVAKVSASRFASYFVYPLTWPVVKHGDEKDRGEGQKLQEFRRQEFRRQEFRRQEFRRQEFRRQEFNPWPSAEIASSFGNRYQLENPICSGRI